MENIPEKLTDILRKSIQMEEEGHRFYTNYAERLENSLAKRMLERLADDELMHIKQIKAIFESVTRNEAATIKIKKAKPISFDAIFHDMRDEMEKALLKKGESGIDDIEIIKIALELENNGHVFYTEAAKKVEDKRLRKFYEALAIEEKSHYDVLRKTHSYLNNPEIFFKLSQRK